MARKDSSALKGGARLNGPIAWREDLWEKLRQIGTPVPKSQLTSPFRRMIEGKLRTRGHT